MIGPPFGRGWSLGRPRGSEKEPEGLGDPSRSVLKADVGGKDLPLRVSQIGKGLAHLTPPWGPRWPRRCQLATSYLAGGACTGALWRCTGLQGLPAVQRLRSDGAPAAAC